jgi:hypothetical protein
MLEAFLSGLVLGGLRLGRPAPQPGRQWAADRRGLGRAPTGSVSSTGRSGHPVPRPVVVGSLLAAEQPTGPLKGEDAVDAGREALHRSSGGAPAGTTRAV